MINLSAAGLNETEANVYQTLLSKKLWKPSDLAKSVGETRTNIYKILDRLVELGLASRFDKDKKLHFRAMHPSRLNDLARERRNKQLEAEKQLESNTDSLLAEYIKVNQQAGVSYFQGKDDIAKIYEDMATTKGNIVFIHSSSSVDFFSFDTLHKLRMLAVKNKVPRFVIAADGPRAPKDYAEKDPLVYLERTWLSQNEYTAPVEIGVYDNKVYIISFGEEALGLTIESSQISAAMRQVLELLSAKQRTSADYESLPKLASASERVH